MKSVGLLGGMSWESSAVYYKILNEEVRRHLGGQHSCDCLMYSVDFGEIAPLQHEGKWAELTVRMIDGALRLQKGGAEMLVICTNTMHLMAPEIEAAIDIPLLHIADATAKAIQEQGLQKVALLGTRFTMEKDFYKTRIRENYGIQVLTPDETDMNTIHDIIYNELVQGVIRDSSREKYQTIIEKLAAAGAEGVILGCTEIPLLIQEKDVSIPVFDTTTLHALAAVMKALGIRD